MTRFVTLDEAAALVGDGCTVGVGGFCGFGAPDSVLRAIGRRFDETGSPRSLTVITPAASGNGTGAPWGLSAIGAPGLIDTILTSVIMLPKSVLDQVNANEIACYCPPLGYFGHMFRALAAGEPGVITHVGVNTYCDPRLDGCKMNARAAAGADIVELVNLGGRELLFYPVVPMDVCLLRGTYADEEGNISCEHEALSTEVLEMANAVHNRGGTVIFQVEKIVAAGTLDPHRIVVHKSAVDYVVLSAPGEHRQGYAIPEYRPEISGEVKVAGVRTEPLPLSARKVIARRAASFIRAGALVNLGLGILEGIAAVAEEEGVIDDFTISIETGVLGGTTLSGGLVGAGVNTETFYKMADTFDLYHGGGLDQCFLSAAEVDEQGNVNVSKFGGRVNGGGGFADITYETAEVFFSAVFTAGRSEVEVVDGQVRVIKNGPGIKFVKRVEQVSFNGADALARGKRVRIITERGVFELMPEGLTLMEIAPGIDLDRDILACMEFTPRIADDLRPMDARLFAEGRMGLALAPGKEN